MMTQVVQPRWHRPAPLQIEEPAFTPMDRCDSPAQMNLRCEALQQEFKHLLPEKYLEPFCEALDKELPFDAKISYLAHGASGAVFQIGKTQILKVFNLYQKGKYTGDLSILSPTRHPHYYTNKAFVYNEAYASVETWQKKPHRHRLPLCIGSIAPAILAKNELLASFFAKDPEQMFPCSLEMWIDFYRSMKRSCDPQESEKLMRDLKRELANLRADKIIHRDIRPANLMMGENNRFRLIDFSLCRKTGESGHVKLPAIGVERYRAPELKGVNAPYSFESDLYSAGVTLYEFATHENLDPLNPFSKINMIESSEVKDAICRWCQEDPKNRQLNESRLPQSSSQIGALR